MHAWERVFGSALLFLFVCGGAAYSQSAALLTAVNGETALTLGNAADLVGIIGGSLPILTDPASAPAELRRIGFSLPKKEPTSTITVGEFSYLVMQILDLPGGLLYSILPGPRSAVRELVSRRLLSPLTFPGSTISGKEALRILGTLARARR